MISSLFFFFWKDESVADETRTTPFPVIIIDSDMEDIEDHRQSYPRENDVSNLPSGETFLKDIAVSLFLSKMF